MTEEQKAEELWKKADKYVVTTGNNDCTIDAYIAGYHECQKEHEWHDLEKDPTDLPKGEEYDLKGIHRKILLQDRYGNIYTGNYYSKDKNHKADCFAVEFLDWGLQGSNFCAKEQISKWKEIE